MSLNLNQVLSLVISDHQTSHPAPSCDGLHIVHYLHFLRMCDLCKKICFIHFYQIATNVGLFFLFMDNLAENEFVIVRSYG